MLTQRSGNFRSECVQRAYIYILVKISPKLNVSSFMGYLKRKSSLIVFDRHAKVLYELASIIIDEMFEAEEFDGNENYAKELFYDLIT